MLQNDIKTLEQILKIVNSLDEKNKDFYLHMAKQLISYHWMFNNENYLIAELFFVYRRLLCLK